MIGRRRKIRCTYITDYPDVCNECRLRGSKCIDQEHNDDDSSVPPGAGHGEQRYSLRERVAHLENIVQGLTKRLDQQSTAASSPGKQQNICLVPLRNSFFLKKYRASVDYL